MNDPQALVFDTETTGLNLHPDAAPHLQPKMIEFGGVLMSLRTGEITAEYSELIYPGQPLSAEIVKITGITDDKLRGMPMFADRLPFLRATFAKAEAVVAHNLPFDKAILYGELTRATGDPSDFPWPARQYCTVGIYREEYGFNPKLTKLYEDKLGKPLAQKHRALDDVLAMVEIIQHERLWEMWL